MGKITTEEYIKRSKEIHGNKYNYSKTVYKNQKTKVIIICPLHGEYLQWPQSHWHNGGCKKCGSLTSGVSRTGRGRGVTTESFIKKANKTHNNKYDYSKTIYKTVHDKITITCLEHGEFIQAPSRHLYGRSGCSKCGNKRKGKLGQGQTTEEFVKLLKEKYKDRYDYSKTIYTGLSKDDKITIICPEHGEFIQRTTNHFYSGAGCPRCKSSIGERLVEDYLKKNNINYLSEYSFKDCKYKRQLRFDFYLPDYNICIEFDGAQHSNSKTHMNGEQLKGQDFKTLKKTR